MSKNTDKSGKVILESSNDSFRMTHISSTPESTNNFPKLTADRSTNFSETMRMINILFKSYETQYQVNTSDKNLLCFPNLFLEPTKGEKIINKATEEVYTIEDTILNPTTGAWEGLVKITSITPPDPLKEERLEFEKDDRLVRFTPEFATSLGIEGQTSEELQTDIGPIRPTIAYALIKKEPGSVGKDLFGPQKQVKPLHKEIINDPKFAGRSVTINVHRFDYLAEFGCFTTDPHTADALADWFEDFMRQNTWVLKLNGVNELLFFQRLRDGAVTKWRQDLISRTVQYAFRIEEILPVINRNIRKIDKLIYSARSTPVLDTKRRIAGREVVGPLTEEEYNKLFYDSNGNYLFGNIFLNDGNF